VDSTERGSQNGEFEGFLLRMEAGAQSNPHEHMGFEEFLVIDGELIDCDGTTYRSGDFVRLMPGSRRKSHCPMAVPCCSCCAAVTALSPARS